jgi:putative (di)nucleoside polyphosphate hydrolase
MMSEADRDLRPCVGICLFHPQGQVFIARRNDLAKNAPHGWQMPQGGIDGKEAPEAAARRELAEETSIRSVKLIGEAPQWITYRYPDGYKRARFAGQRQKWFAYLFDGDPDEINVLDPAGSKAEFDAWDFVDLTGVPELIVPFKRAAYEQVVAAFLPLTRKLQTGLSGEPGQ